MTEPPRRPCSNRDGRRHRQRERNRWGSSVDRGQSTALEYTLTLGITALVVTGLFAAAGDFVSTQREDVVRTELGVVGEHLTNELVAADRLVQAGNRTDRLAVNASMPRRVAGASYTIAITQTGTNHWMNLTADDPDVSIAVKVETETDVETGRYQGGSIDVIYDPAADRLEVRS